MFRTRLDFKTSGRFLVHTTLANSGQHVSVWQDSVRDTGSWADLVIIMLEGTASGITEEFLSSIRSKVCLLFLDNHYILGTDLKDFTFIDCGSVRGNSWAVIETRFAQTGRIISSQARKILKDWPVEEVIRLGWSTPQSVISEEFVKMFSVTLRKNVFAAAQNLLIHGKKKGVVRELVRSMDNAQELLGVLYHELHCLIVIKTINQKHAHTTAIRLGIPAFRVKHYRDMGRKMELKDLYRHMKLILELRLSYTGDIKSLLALIISAW